MRMPSKGCGRGGRARYEKVVQHPPTQEERDGSGHRPESTSFRLVGVGMGIVFKLVKFGGGGEPENVKIIQPYLYFFTPASEFILIGICKIKFINRSKFSHPL